MSLEKFEQRILGKKLKPATILDYDIFPIPLGSIIEVQSLDSEHWVAFDLAKKFQNEIFWLDGDHSIDWQLYKDMGGYSEKILVAQPSDPKNYFQILHKLMDFNGIRIIVCNSALTMYPQDNDYQWFTDSLLILKEEAVKNQKVVIILNPYATGRYQLIDKYADVIMEFRKRQVIKRGEQFIGYHIDGQVVKTKFYLPTNEFKCKLLYNKGLEKC